MKAEKKDLGNTERKHPMNRTTALLAATVLMFATVAYALPVEVPDFSRDPSNGKFSIVPIGADEGASQNTIGPPELYFGVTDPVSGTPNTMQMNWQPVDPYDTAQAGWALVFGEDPDLTNQMIIMSINPPGIGGGPAGGGPVGGITHVEVHMIDMANALVGGWGFNTDQATSSPPGWLPLANDFVPFGQSPVFPIPAPPQPWPPAPGQLASLAQNFMQTVTINVGAGPVPGSATVIGGPAGLLIGPNYLIGGNNNLTQVAKLEFYENGVLAGNVAVPAGAQPGLNNYWDHITVTPEPATLSLLVLGGLALIRRRRA